MTEIPAEKFAADALARIAGYIEFRIEHLKSRYRSGEQSAYVRLTEIEAMRDYIESARAAAGDKNK